jgi:hypothetical protein
MFSIFTPAVPMFYKVADIKYMDRLFIISDTDEFIIRWKVYWQYLGSCNPSIAYYFHFPIMQSYNCNLLALIGHSSYYVPLLIESKPVYYLQMLLILDISHISLKLKVFWNK